MYCGLKTKTSLRPIFMESNQDQLHVREKQDCIFGGKFEEKKTVLFFISLPLRFQSSIYTFTLDFWLSLLT